MVSNYWEKYMENQLLLSSMISHPQLISYSSFFVFNKKWHANTSFLGFAVDSAAANTVEMESVAAAVFPDTASLIHILQ